MSKYCSPHMISLKENLCFKMHCARCVGDLSQSQEDKSVKIINSLMSLDHISLSLSVGRKEGHGMLHLQASKIVYRKKITLALTNEWYIKKEHYIDKHEGMTRGLKTKYMNDPVYFDSHWSAGVDHHCENQYSRE